MKKKKGVVVFLVMIIAMLLLGYYSYGIVKGTAAKFPILTGYLFFRIWKAPDRFRRCLYFPKNVFRFCKMAG